MVSKEKAGWHEMVPCPRSHHWIFVLTLCSTALLCDKIMAWAIRECYRSLFSEEKVHKLEQKLEL